MHLRDVYHYLIHYYWSHYQSECVYCCYIRFLDWVIRRMSIIMRWDTMLIRDWRSWEERGYMLEEKETMMQS